ncbi:MAG: sigma-E factor regulatory protein RseB domain-containing protein [bacterium]
MRTLAAALLLVSLGLLVRPAAAQAPSLELLLRAAVAHERVAYSAEQLLATWEGQQPHLALAHVQHDPAVGTRLVYRPLSGGHDRRVVWHTSDRTLEYDPHTRRGRVYPAYRPQVSARQQVAWLMRNYSVSSAPSRLLGRQTQRLKMVPRQPGRPTATVHVDVHTGVILRSERTSADGGAREFSSFVNFTPRPVGWMRSRKLPEDLQLRREPPPRTATLQEVTSAFGRHLPDVQLPDGFSPVTAFLVEDRGTTVRRAYSDGLTTLVVSWTPQAAAAPPAGSRVVYRRGGPVWVRSSGLRQLVHWQHAGWAITLVAELSPDVLLEVADRTGIQPAPSALDVLLDWLRTTLALEPDA